MFMARWGEIRRATLTAISYAFLLGLLYILATCGSLLVASNRILAIVGPVKLLVVIALSALTFTSLTSLWRAWAAVSSVAIAVHLRRSGAAPAQRA